MRANNSIKTITFSGHGKATGTNENGDLSVQLKSRSLKSSFVPVFSFVMKTHHLYKLIKAARSLFSCAEL